MAQLNPRGQAQKALTEEDINFANNHGPFLSPKNPLSESGFDCLPVID
jgi:hypothetical protein